MQFQVIDIPFGQGPNEKIDGTLLPNGVLAAAVDCLFDKSGACNKRNGFTSYTASIFGGTTLSDVKRIASCKEELMLLDGHKAYSLDETNSKWIDKGPTVEPYCSVQTVQQDPTGSMNWSVVAENQGIRAIAFGDNNGKVILKVVDTVTGASVLPRTVVATGNFPQLVVAGNFIWLTYASGTNVIGFRLDVTAPSTISGPTTIAADFNAAGYYDTCPLDATTWILAYYGTTTGNNVSVCRVNTSGVIGTIVRTVEPPTNSIGVCATSGEAIYVTWHNNANGQRAWGLNPATLGVLFAAATVSATTVPVSGLSTVCRLSATSALVVWREEATAAVRAILRMRSVTNAGVMGTAQNTPSLGIVSKPFAHDGHMYVLAQNSSLVGNVTNQPTYFLVDLDVADLASSPKTVRVVAALKGSSGVGRNFGTLPAPALTSATGQYVIVAAGRSRFNLAAGHGDILYQFTFDMAPALDRRWLWSEFGQATILTGGVTSSYDGASAVECGFFLYPEFGTGVQNTTGTMATGTYGVAFVYSWRDTRGQRYMSAPQFVTGIPVVGPTGSIDVAVPPIHITAKSDRLGGTDNAISIDVYVTDLNGDVYFYNQTLVNTTAASASRTGTITAVNTTAEELYTTGGVLEDSMPSASTAIAVHDNRIWLVTCDDPKEIRYSKELTVGEAPAFNEGLTVRIDAGGNVTALASMDDKVIVFKATAIFAITGQGAVDTGTGSSLTVTPILAETGCTEPRSVVATPQGILFRGAKGMYLLDRSLQLSYIGANVENTLLGNPQTLSATLLDDARRIVFCVADGSTAEGAMVVYDTLGGAWATWNPTLKSTHGGGTPTSSVAFASACIHRGLYVAASRSTGASLANGPAYYYDAATFKDDSLYPIVLNLTTGPLRAAGQQGWQRVRRVTLLLTRKSAYGLTVNQYNDFPVFATTAHTTTFDSAATAASASTGQVSFRPKYQKCEAMALDIFDGPALDATFGEGFSISGIALEVGSDPITFRLPPQART